MSRCLSFAVAVLVSCGAKSVALAGDLHQSSKQATVASLRAEILAMDDRLAKIYRTGDLPGLKALYAPDYLGYWAGQRAADLATVQREFPKVKLLEFHRDFAVVKELAPGVALLNEDGTMRETYNGVDVSGRYHYTTIWIKRAGRWRLLFEQEVPFAVLSPSARHL
jgi:ketosteroid isomerase-like protein